ncbi:MAG: TMEM165/GDT1 family protein [Gammaproteobacteria bacterium]|nr:TMEM165/GDT1 family protein [Gammaproteobacteria bacterium]
MDLKIFFTIYAAIFVAELGDKTQLATLLFGTDKSVSKWLVFAASSLALITAAGIAVLAAAAISSYVSEKQLNMIAGLGFIAIGIFTILKILGTCCSWFRIHNHSGIQAGNRCSPVSSCPWICVQ